jgi:hypothetical protein
MALSKIHKQLQHAEFMALPEKVLHNAVWVIRIQAESRKFCQKIHYIFGDDHCLVTSPTNLKQQEERFPDLKNHWISKNYCLHSMCQAGPLSKHVQVLINEGYSSMPAKKVQKRKENHALISTSSKITTSWNEVTTPQEMLHAEIAPSIGTTMSLLIATTASSIATTALPPRGMSSDATINKEMSPNAVNKMMVTATDIGIVLWIIDDGPDDVAIHV